MIAVKKGILPVMAITIIFLLLIIGIFFQSKASAVILDQKGIYDAGIPYYELSVAEKCNADITGDSPAEQAFMFFISTNIASNDNKPMNAAQAAGMVGNLMIETGGKTYDLKPDLVNSIGASGIAQWLGKRKSDLDAFAGKQGKTWTDFQVQLKFIIIELENGYKNAVMNGKSTSNKTVDKGLKNITDVSEQGAKDSADIIARYYEIPSIADSYPNRQQAAAKAFNDFKGNAGGISGSPTSNCGSSTTDGDGSAQALISKVKEFAWEDGRRGSAQKPAYTAAIQGRYQGGKNGNDCGAFVSALMVKSGFEPNYPGTNTTGQKAWLDKNWKKIADPGTVDTSNLRPGDVGVVSGSHVFVWVGDVEGFAGKSAEAALGSNTAPTAIKSGNTFSLPSKYTWYRKDG